MVDPSPTVTVIMPVLNAEQYVGEAISSILAQTLADFEFLIVNDGSTDGTVDVIQSFNDPRIRVHHHDRPMKLPCSLNWGLNEARGEFVARMDADDIAYPKRLAQQVDFLTRNPQVQVLGTGITSFGGGQPDRLRTYPAHHDNIRAKLLFDSPMAHPTIMFRRSFMEKYQLRYDETLRFGTEDYDLWIRASRLGKFANLKTPLLCYRSHIQQVSSSQENLKEANQIRKKLLNDLGLEVTETDVLFHFNLLKNTQEKSEPVLQKTLTWLNTLMTANRQSHYFEEEALVALLSEVWLRICMKNRILGLKTWQIHRHSSFTRSTSPMGNLVLLGKCLKYQMS